MDTRQVGLLACRQADEHTGLMAGRYGVGDPWARRTLRLTTEKTRNTKGNLVCTTVVETTIWR